MMQAGVHAEGWPPGAAVFKKCRLNMSEWRWKSASWMAATLAYASLPEPRRSIRSCPSSSMSSRFSGLNVGVNRRTLLSPSSAPLL
eukprot:COSAG03_NODE_584_length_6857_cov_339.944362_2_plen_86_part_00